VRLGGIWEGTTTANTYSPNLADPKITIFTTDDGEFRLVSDSALQAEGIVSIEEAIPLATALASDAVMLSGSISAYLPQGFVFSDGSTRSECTVSVNFIEQEEMMGSYYCVGDPGDPEDDDSGLFEAFYNQDRYEPDQGSSLEQVARVWSGLDFSTTNNDVVLTLNIEDDGDILGENTDGCVIAGSIITIDTDFNLYDIGFTLTNCAELNGAYSGLATLGTDLDTGYPKLTYQVDNGTVIVTQNVFDGFSLP